MKQTWFGALGAVTIAAISIATVGCDPRSEALGLFASKGLNLLSPARDYIKPGGMVFLTKGGHPEYDDPADSVGPENGNLTDFRANILEEALHKTSKLSAALSLAKTILPMSFSADAQSDSDVSLKGIETTGVRLSTEALDRLIGMPNTSQAAAHELANKTRVFIVQEIYLAKSLDLSTGKTRAFSLKYDNGSVIADCRPASDSGSKSGTATPAKKDVTLTKEAAGGSGTGKAAQTATKKEHAAKDATGGSGTGTGTPTEAKTGAAGTKGTGQSGSGPAADGTSKLQAGVAVCVSEAYTLKLNTQVPIPFAVRLAELKLSGKTVVRDRSGKTFTSTLGRGSEISGAVVSDSEPVLQGITRRVKTH